MGRAAIIYVVGLGIIVGIIIRNMGETGLSSQDSHLLYYGRTVVHNIALSSANVGCQRVLFNSGYGTPFSGSFSGGTYSVRYDSTIPAQKTVIACAEYRAGLSTLRDTVLATFEYTRFSRYGWFTDTEQNGYVSPSGIRGPYYGDDVWKITGDSLFGFIHTNGRFHFSGTPYLHRKVTASAAPTLSFLGGKQAPIYNGGYEWGVTIPRDTANIIALKAASNIGTPLPTSYYQNKDVGFEFFNTGNVRIRIPWNTGIQKDTTMSVSALSSTGVVGVFGGDAHVKGTYRGQVTVCAFKGGGTSGALKGNTWIDGNLVAATNPAANPTSTDMFGLISERMSYITRDNSRNSSSVLEIQAAIYCHNGEFTAQDFWTIAPSGRINLYGGLCQETSGGVGLFGSFGVTNGFYKSYRHDSRFLNAAPPVFPVSTKFRLISWWEN
jgi:hypothetical protein